MRAYFDRLISCFLRLLLTVPLLLPWTARGEDEFERPPIEYSRATPNNRIATLQQRLSQEQTSLRFDQRFGYLPALLAELRIPVDSQMLVYSKTSLQRQRIAPRTPRAIYFSDDAYVGYCHGGDVLEVSVADPQLGAVFYTLSQTRSDTPALQRKTHNCLLCHSSSQVGAVPSHLVRSVFVDASGLPILSEGSFQVNHSTPLEQRWGGWYVSGTHGAQMHLGNLIVGKTPIARPVTNPAGLNVSDLAERFDTQNYLTPHSDLVALMVFEHQTHVHNLITQANFETRRALHYEAEFNRGLGEPPDNRLQSTTRRIASAGERLVKGLLLCDEAPLTAPIRGTSEFAARFAAEGPRDARARSLRELDLNTRLFKYPCSYLIESECFDALPPEMLAYVTRRLREVLTAPEAEKEFAHLSAADRTAIWEILSETKPALFAQP